MANATVVSVQTRIHAINQQLNTVRAERYFVPAGMLHQARLPLIFSIPGRDRLGSIAGEYEDHIIRTYELTIVCWDWLASEPVKTAQEMSEAAIDEVRDQYLGRSQLQYNGVMLDGVIDCQVGSASGVVPLSYAPQFASITIPLDVETIKTIIPILEDV